METPMIIAIAIALLLLTGFVFYRILRSYVHEEFGRKWLMIWGNKVYFWQSLIFMSMAFTVLIMYLLKWSNVLSF